ncbi:MAG: peptidylprolyl isomerase [Caulobacter sp.]|nr:peptidylprolyl isomerase [Caulobacter sp.]
MTEPMTPIREWTNVTPQVFHDQILPVGQPAVFKSFVADWPVVAAARQSPAALSAYLKRFDRGASVPTLLGPPKINGRFFYNHDMSGFNFQQGSARIGAALDFLLARLDEEPPPAFAIQSAPIRGCMPGFEAENRLTLLDPAIEPRAWIGNRVIVAAHHDQSENIACVVAGRRRFTLFPPDQVANLYMGPFELTPAGATISMVDFDAPDLGRYPNFPQALDAAVVADLEPGDAIYIPYLWWHHVRSMDRLNMLVNYWWAPRAPGRPEPREAFVHAIVALRDLPKAHREAWRAMLAHYVFQDEGPAPGAHLPKSSQGILGDLDPQLLREIRTSLARSLGRS